ncbi:MAG: AAA family ATPase, partial [Actinomycetota bacterium]|nr:AAA family ATPase [Actinomycetota bacterium]
MRITGWRVDGFGVLADHRVDEIPPGLTIVHGPNEAGKSTLLDFVRDVLFGFPGGSTPKRAPRRGGRYGGTLFLADDDGLAWTVERHDRADAVVTGPGGVVAADSALPRLLGGVDRKVFESIFAFGLDELAAIRALDAEEVRDLVFSAGVLGAGRSATRAREALKKRREVLVRPRQPSAVTNRLRGELDELDRQLAGLRAGALSYPAVAERCRQLRDRARAARDGSERARHRSHELAVLEACWPDRAALVLAERERAADPGPSPRDLALRELAGEIERLGRDRSGQDERL